MISSGPVLLDTCAAIWTTHDKPIHPEAEARLTDDYAAGRAVYVSPITAWEAGMMTSRGRVVLANRPLLWFANLLAAPGVSLAGMPPEVLIESSNLPGSPPRDPSDRILIATAREYGFTIMTRDAEILDYANSGLVMALPC